MKYVIALIAILIVGAVIMTTNSSNPTKIPYNNGFYAGPYNPKLPVIDPKG